MELLHPYSNNRHFKGNHIADVAPPNENKFDTALEE